MNDEFPHTIILISIIQLFNIQSIKYYSLT